MTLETVIACLVCFITSVFSGMGAGGGGILTLYLSVFAGMDQAAAQGVNLTAFIFALAPSAAVNAARYKPDIRLIAFLTFCGTTGCIFGALLSSYAPDALLRKCCGAFLSVTGAAALIKQARLNTETGNE